MEITERKVKLSLIERLMGGVPKKQSMYEHRIFLNVNPKSLWTPVIDSLNSSEICPSFC